MKPRLVLIVLAVCISSLLLACPRGDPYALWRAQPNPFVVVVSKVDSEAGEVYLLDKVGVATRLTNNARMENNVALSPDRTKVAFHAGAPDDYASWEIFVLDLATLEETQVTDNAVLDGHPDWSPDGSRIVFASFQDDQGNPTATADVYVVNVDGTGLVRLTDSPWEDNDPEWSPDGTMIAFKSTRRTQQAAREEVYVMDADGGNVRRLTTTSGWESDHDVSWSPDSSTIAFMRFSGTRPWTDIGNPEVVADHWDEVTPWNPCKVDLEGNFVQLTDTDQVYALPVFSADGAKVLFYSIEPTSILGVPTGARRRLYLINADGGGQAPLVPDGPLVNALEYFDW